MKEDLVKKYKVSKFYKYVENQEGNAIQFGWQATSDAEMPVVISYGSKSKLATDKEREWSLQEGVSATSLLDYRAYFNSLVGQSPEEFLTQWESKIEVFPLYWAGKEGNSTEEQGAFIVALASLITKDKRFSMFGRVYKVIR